MNIKLRIENVGNIKSANEYWDCECNNNYIHNKGEFTCVLCNAISDDQPDSRVNEVKRMLKSKNVSIA